MAILFILRDKHTIKTLTDRKVAVVSVLCNKNTPQKHRGVAIKVAVVFVLCNKHTIKTLRDYKEDVVFILLYKHTLKTPRDYKVDVESILRNKNTLQSTRRLQNGRSICPVQQIHT